MDDYPLIADHGLIGDLQTAALVTTDGTIDWFCAPRFDSPSIFGALLDHRAGGRFRIRPAAAAFSSKQMYLPDTAILITRFLTEAGVGEIVDFMPVSGKVATDRHRLVRLLRCVRGEMTFEVEISPTLRLRPPPAPDPPARQRRRVRMRRVRDDAARRPRTRRRPSGPGEHERRTATCTPRSP